tara:strand:+ start:8783 stop:9082 length:300 start_codon:yes stop_codon:yes gene_type:complete
MGKYLYYKVILPYSIDKGSKINVKTEYGDYYLKIYKFFKKEEEINFKIFIENSPSNNYNNEIYNTYYDEYYYDDDYINPFDFSIINTNYKNKFNQYSCD